MKFIDEARIEVIAGDGGSRILDAESASDIRQCLQAVTLAAMLPEVGEDRVDGRDAIRCRTPGSLGPRRSSATGPGWP